MTDLMNIKGNCFVLKLSAKVGESYYFSGLEGARSEHTKAQRQTVYISQLGYMTFNITYNSTRNRIIWNLDMGNANPRNGQFDSSTI